jgi:hypothetical protein
MEVWISTGLSPNEVQGTRELFGNDPRLTLTLRPSKLPILRIISDFEFALLARDTAPFLTFSPLAFRQLKSVHIDPLQFRLPNGVNRIKNVFLLGKTISFCLIPDPTQDRLRQLVHDMAGVVRSTSDVDFLVSSEPLKVGSKAVVVRPSWIDALWPSEIFISPGVFAFSPHPLFRDLQNR